MPRDGTLLGALFESIVTLSTRVYAQAAEASVKHLRTASGAREIDLLGDTLTCLGETLLALGETAEAASVIEEAIAVFEAKGMVPAVAGARELLASRASAG